MTNISVAPFFAGGMSNGDFGSGGGTGGNCGSSECGLSGFAEATVADFFVEVAVGFGEAGFGADDEFCTGEDEFDADFFSAADAAFFAEVALCFAGVAVAFGGAESFCAGWTETATGKSGSVSEERFASVMLQTRLAAHRNIISPERR